MLSREKFKKCIDAILLLKNIDYVENRSKRLYILIKNDFSDENFEEICGYIARVENLYNKYPDPSLFYKHIVEKNKKIASIEEINSLKKFLDVVREYWEVYILDDDRGKINNNFNKFEKYILSLSGGIFTIRQDLRNHNEGVFGGKSKFMILSKLTKDFKDNYGSNIEDGFLIERKSGGIKSLGKLLEKKG